MNFSYNEADNLTDEGSPIVLISFSECLKFFRLFSTNIRSLVHINKNIANQIMIAEQITKENPSLFGSGINKLLNTVFNTIFTQLLYL